MRRNYFETLIGIALVLLGVAVLRASTRTAGRVIPAAAMHEARASHTATLLKDGRVLVTGGMVENGVFLATTEVFDPAKNAFVELPPMAARRTSHAAVRLPDGRVLITGGLSGRKQVAGRWVGDTLDAAEIFDSRKNAFTAAGRMTMPRAAHDALLLPDGRVIIIGGENERQFLNSTEFYDPRTSSFTAGPSMLSPRISSASVVLKDGRVLVAGGSTEDRGVLASAEIYDPASRKWSAVGDMTMPRHKHAAILMNDGRVLVVGGSDNRDWSGQYTSAEIFDPATGKFTACASMVNKRFKLSNALAILPNGNVVVGGGSTAVEVYDATSKQFVPAEGALDEPNYFAQATELADHRVLITGGYGTGKGSSKGPVSTRSAWLFQP